MRVRSFGEKESIVLLGSSAGSSSGVPIREDYITLRVHGITNAGVEIQNDLVQVLQNRLDDAVLEMLSVMLARNPMCKLSPEDVHFIQRPYHPPEVIVQVTIILSYLLELKSKSSLVLIFLFASSPFLTMQNCTSKL